MLNKENLVDLVSEICKIEKEKVFKRDRQKDVVMARHVICYFARNYLLMGLEEIGKWLGVHHSTVIHAIGKVETFIWIKEDFYTNAVDRTNEMIKERFENDIKLLLIVPYNVNISEFAKELQNKHGIKVKRLVD